MDKILKANATVATVIRKTYVGHTVIKNGSSYTIGDCTLDDIYKEVLDGKDIALLIDEEQVGERGVLYPPFTMVTAIKEQSTDVDDNDNLEEVTVYSVEGRRLFPSGSTIAQRLYLSETYRNIDGTLKERTGLVEDFKADSSITKNSSRPVTSRAIYTALQGIYSRLEALEGGSK